jgi:hypothetical protein
LANAQLRLALSTSSEQLYRAGISAAAPISTALNVDQKVNSVDTTNKPFLACDGSLRFFQADLLPTPGYDRQRPVVIRPVAGQLPHTVNANFKK